MKKTIIALMALAGVAAADTYEYVGNKTGGWAEVNTNWKSVENETNPSTNGNQMNTGTGNTFVIDGNKQVKAGANLIAANTTLIIKGGSELYIDGGPTFNNSTVTFEDGAISSCNPNGNGSVKIKDTTFNINSTLSFGRLTFNNDAAMGDMTFNLGEKGKVSFASTFVVAGTSPAKYNGQITLSAICTDGFLTGYGDISVYDRVLVDFGSKVDHSDCAEFSTFLDSEYVTAGSFTLNDEKLSAGKYSVDALSAEDVGKYQFVMEGSKLKVQYVAYSVPEPTTATLSLLALAGLAARRRRK